MIDASCEAKRVELALPDKTVVLRHSQLNREPGLMNVNSDTIVSEIRRRTPFQYSVSVEFEGCPPIQGPSEYVDRGSLFYVWVTDDGVKHQIRG